jgi:hypothetical protein
MKPTPAKPKISMAQVEGSGTTPTLITAVNVPGPGKLLVVKVKVSPTSEKSPPAKLSKTDVMLEKALSFSVNTRGELDISNEDLATVDIHGDSISRVLIAKFNARIYYSYRRSSGI